MSEYIQVGVLTVVVIAAMVVAGMAVWVAGVRRERDKAARAAEHLGDALDAWSETVRHGVHLADAGDPAGGMAHIRWYAEQAGVLDGLTAPQEARHG